MASAWDNLRKKKEKEEKTQEAKKPAQSYTAWDNLAARKEKERQKELESLKAKQQQLSTYSGAHKAAQEADYYREAAAHDAKWYDKASYDKNYAAYQDTLKAANSSYRAEDALRQSRNYMQDMMRGANPFRALTPVKSAGQDLARQAGRLSSDAAFYQQMAKDAAAMGSQELLDQAQRGLERSGGRYDAAYNAYADKAKRALDDLKGNNKAAWYAQTLSREQIEGQLRQLEQRKAKAEQELSTAYDAWRVGSQNGEEEVYNAKEKALQDIEDEIATYNSALGYRKSYDYSDIRRKYTNESGKLAVGQLANRDRGRQMYEADRTKALREGGLNADLGDDLSTGRGAHIRYRDSIREAGYFDRFEDAQHLNEEDRDIFYALYAEDPEKAREWMTIAKTERDEQYQTYLSRLVDLRAGEHLGTAGKLADIGAVGAGFVLGTGSNIAAGVANLIDPYSETALELSRAGQAFLSGGSKMLNREFGTIDEKIPFIGNILGGKGLGDLYQLASSVVQSHLTAGVAANAGELSEAVQALGVVLMGSSAAASDYDESLKRGLTEQQARQHAFAAGLNEAAFEWISLDKLVNPDFGASAIKQWLTQSGIEASEEFCTTIANRLTDGMLARRNGYDTQIEQRMKELIARGVDRETAQQQAEHEWTTELINDALGGFLSGGAGQMVNVATGYGLSKFGDVADRMRFANNQTEKLERQGAAITSQEELQALQSYAKANNISFDRDAEAKLTEAGSADASDQNDKLSRKERRQQAKSNRSTGVVQEQVVRGIANTIRDRGLDQAQAVYDETVSKHGQGIARQAAAAVSRAASEQLGKLNNSAELEQAYKAASAGVTEPAVRKAIEQAYNIQAYAIAQRTGNEEAVERIQQRVRNTSASGSRNLSLDVQVTNEDGSTGTAQITGVTANAKQVKLSNGQTVDVDKLSGIDADTKDVLDRIAFMEVGPAANLMWNAYQLEVRNGTMTDGYRWIMDYTTAFDQGRQGSVSLDQAIGRAGGLSPQIAEIAYQQGRDTAKEMTDRQKADLEKRMSITRKGATGRAGTVNTDAIAGMRLSEAQKKQLDIVKRIAEVFGIDVEVFASGTKNVTVNGKKMQVFQGENGSYQDGRIRLDINAGLNYVGDIGSGLVATMGHELTHFIQEFAPEEYRAYKEFVLATIARTKGSQGLERLIREKIDRSKNGLSRAKAEDEVVADAAQTVLTDSNALRQMAEQEPTLFEKVLQWIKDFFGEIRDALANSPRMSEEARLFRGLEADVRKAFGELWDKGITEAARVHDQVGDIEGSQEQNSDRDTEYLELAKDPEKNRDKLQEMVDEAAKNAGYVLSAFHGTAERFNVFRRGLEGIHLGNERQARQRAKISSEKAERSRYAWSDVRKRLQEFNQDTITSLVRIARNTVAWGADWETEPQHFDGDTKNLNAVRNYIDDMAEQYAKGTDGRALDFLLPTFDRDVRPNMMDLYARISNPLKVDHDVLEWTTPNIARMLLDASRGNGKEFVVDGGKTVDISTSRIDFTDEELERLESIKGFDNDANWDTIADILAAHGYDGIQYVNEYEGDRKSPSYIALHPADVKRADPVTYDDSGNVIPLSERFNRENQDIRYSSRPSIENMTEDQLRDDLRETQQEFYAARKEYQSISDTEEHKKLIDAMVSKENGAVERYAEWAKISGYEDAYKRMTAAQERMDKGQKRISQLVDERMEAEESRAIEKSGLSEAEYFRKQAVKEFGYTPYFYDAGYILPNGKLLNFSGEKGRHFGSRGQDHRAIGQIYANSTGSAAMTRFMNDGNVRIMAESPGLDVSGTMPLTSEQYSTIRKFVNQVRGEEYFNLDFTDERGNTIDSIEYEGRINAERVVNDIKHFFETGEVRHPSGLSAFYSERDYDQPSDFELMDQAAESLSEAGGEEYWNALLESAPELADDKAEIQSMAKAYREQAKKLAEAEKRLTEAKRNLTTTDRKLRTRGIAGMTLEIMKSLEAGDVKGRHVAQRVTEIITRAYQKGLDAIDAGKDAGAVWDIVWNEGVEKAADYLLENATHSEKYSYGWTTAFLNKYMPGEDGRWAVLDAISAKVVQDWSQNRMREPIQETAADRIVQRVEGRMQKQIDEQTERADTAEAKVSRLQEDVNIWKESQIKASDAARRLQERLDEVKAELKQSQSMNAKERRAKRDQAQRLNNRLQAKRQEAAAWKKLAERNEALLNAALKSKNADIDALRVQMDRNTSEAEKKQAALVQKLADQVKREQDILSGKLKPPAMQKLLKAEREKAAREAEQHKDEVFQNYKERKRQSDLRSRIKNLSDEMKHRMTNPSERAYVPASLYESMTRLADLLDDVLSPKPGTKAAAKYRAMMDAIHGLAREYSAVKDMDDPVYSSEYDEEIQDAINDIERILARKDASWIDELTGDTKKGLRELSTGELQRIYELMRSINYSMVGATAMLGHSSFRNVFEAMQAVVDQQNGMESLNSLSPVKRWNRSRLLDNLSVMRAVEMMSGWERDAALYQLMHNIEQGTDESWAWRMAYNKSMEALKTGKNEKEYRQALTKKLDYGVTDEEGRKVLMTKMQALQILMTAEREAHNDKLLHLQTGGAKIRDAIDLQNGKGAEARSQTIRVTPELIQRIHERLTDWDQAYMQNVRDYFRKEGRRTNEILYKIKHRVLQTEDYYIPYKVDNDYLETKLTENEAMNMWVKTPGSTNALKQKAKQPVIIDGMDTVMGRHVKEMGDYIGLAIPIRDFSKVYNGLIPTGEDNPLPVKKTIDEAFGSKGQHLLTQAVIDVQGGGRSQSWRSGISDFLSKLQGAFVRSALLINPSVTIKQAASYIAAESVLSHRALVAGNRATFASQDKAKSPALIAHLFANPEGKTAQRIYNEIDQHTSLHYQRRQGMSQAEIANEANRNGAVKRWMNGVGARMEQNRIGHAVRKAGENLNPVTWIQRMDVATTATLWVACKEQAKMDGMETGTAEFWQRTTELYERVIRETQPMYDSLHRTAHQKQAGTLTQYLFPFRTVPIQNHGQLAASYEALKASKGKSKAKQAGARKFFAKTVWAQTESAAIFSLMTFIAAALKRKTRKYRDEDEEMTAGSVGMGLGKDVLSTLFSVLQPMYGSELVSIGSRALDKFEGSSGYTYDAFSVGVVDMINDLASSGDKLLADAGKLTRGEDVSFEDFRDHALAMLTKGAKLAGIPADTVKTYAQGLLGNIEDAIAGRIPAINDESWERKIGVNAQRLVKAAVAGDTQKVEAVLEEMRGNILEEKPNLKEDKVNGRIQNAVTSYVKAQYMDGNLSEAKATEIMVQYGSSDDEHEAYWKIREWEAKAEHADDDEYSFNKYEDLRAILADNGDISSEVKRLTDHGVKADSVNKDVKATIKDLFNEGTITESEAIAMLQKYHQTKDDKTKQYRADTADEAWFIVDEWKEGAESDEEDFNYTKYSDLREAIRTGGNVKDEIDLLTGHGVTEKAVYEDVNKTINTMLSDGAINGDKAEDLLQKYGKVKDSETKAYRAITEDEAWAKVREWQGNIEHAEDEDYSYSQYDAIDEAIAANQDIKALVKELTDHGVEEKNITNHVKAYLVDRYVDGKANETQLKKQLSRYCKIVGESADKLVRNANVKKATGYSWDDLDSAYRDGNVSAAAAKQALTEYGKLSTDDANARIRYWDFKKAYPDSTMQQETVDKYYNSSTLRSSGLTLDNYVQYYTKASKATGTDKNGDGRTDSGSLKVAKMNIINDLNITTAQKDALYYFNGWSAKTIWEAPWH